MVSHITAHSLTLSEDDLQPCPRRLRILIIWSANTYSSQTSVLLQITLLRYLKQILNLLVGYEQENTSVKKRDPVYKYNTSQLQFDQEGSTEKNSKSPCYHQSIGTYSVSHDPYQRAAQANATFFKLSADNVLGSVT